MVAALTILDLCAQAAFLPPDVLKPPDRFLRWLWQHGEVGRWSVERAGRSTDVYAFRSVCGLEASFWFDEQGHLYVDLVVAVNRQVFRRQGVLLRGVFPTMRKP